MSDLYITTYGAKPGPAHAAATRYALERCVELSAAAGVVRPIVVPNDQGGYIVDRPVFLSPAAGGDAEFFVRGDAPGAILAGAGAFPPLVLGLRQSPVDLAANKVRRWDASRYVDAFGVLDRTAAPKAGARWGLRTANDTVYAFPASPLSHGPMPGRWPAVRVLTVDVAYQVNANSRSKPGPDTGRVQLLGIGPSSVPRPFFVSLEAPDRVLVWFGTADPSGEEVITRTFGVPLPEEGGSVRRLGFEIDLDRASVRAWAGDRRVAVDDRLGDDWTPGLSFADNDVSAFKLGGLGDNIAGWSDNFGGPVDCTFFGLRIGTGRRYVEGEVGSVQARPDGTPADDAYRYFDAGAGMVGYLPLDDVPGASRCVRCVAGRPNLVATYGFALVGDHHSSPYNAGSRVRLADLDLRGGSEGQPYGAALFVGGSLQGMQFERCRLTGGYYGAASLMTCVNYPMLWRDCTFRGCSGDGYFGDGQTVRFAGVTSIQYPARNGARLRGCGASFDQLFISEAGPRCETYLRMDGGGSLVVRGPTLDTEYAASPIVAGVLAERGPDMPGSRLVIEDGAIDGVAPDAPLVWLKDVAPPEHTGYHGSTFRMAGVATWKGDRPGPTVRTDGPGWSGRVEDFMGAPARVEDMGTFGPGRVAVR